jgi:CheY-like chemotaxis protein
MGRLGWFPDLTWNWGAGPDSRRLLRYRLQGRRASPVHVLMIEDDSSIAEMYRLQLEHDGFRVTVATNAGVGFKTLTGDAPDIVLLDLLLPDQSGFDVLATLNERFAEPPPVVILSNYGEPSMIDRGLSLGAVEYLVKSRVTPADVSGQIPEWVERGRRGGKADS